MISSPDPGQLDQSPISRPAPETLPQGIIRNAKIAT